MARISARTATWAKWAVVPAALLVSGVAVSQASYSAFSATTQSEANNWKAGTVALDTSANKSTGTAMFSASNLKPGDSGVKCITVTSSGSLASTVKLFSATAATTATAPVDATKDLSPWITLGINEGTGADSACTDFTAAPDAATPYAGTLADFKTAKTFASGWGKWAPAGGTVTRTYKITYTLNSNVPNTLQGGAASVGFTWEAQNS
jgi:hypothetical protein